MEVTVSKKYIRQSPKKIRPNLHILRGKNAQEAADILTVKSDKASKQLLKLLKSGISAAEERDMNKKNLIISEIACNQGPRLKRHRYAARGRVARIVKRMSHLELTLSDKVK